MSNEFKKEFISQCRKNRIYLGFDYKDMANCLIDVSKEEYEEFENGNFAMTKENIDRITRVLCIEKPRNIDVDKYLDKSGLSEEEVNDLSNIVKMIVGEEDDQ